MNPDLEGVLVSLGAVDEHDSRLKKQENTSQKQDSDDEYYDDWD
jgi:hypothetical protein